MPSYELDLRVGIMVLQLDNSTVNLNTSYDKIEMTGFMTGIKQHFE